MQAHQTTEGMRQFVDKYIKVHSECLRVARMAAPGQSMRPPGGRAAAKTTCPVYFLSRQNHDLRV